MTSTAATAVLVLVAACGSADPAPRTASPSAAGPVATASSPAAPLAAGAGCSEMATAVGGRQVRFGVDGATNLAGVAAGTGATGIVLAHELRGDVCQWSETFVEYVRAGYRVLAFDFHGFGASESTEEAYDDEVVAAAATLRADGATSIVLIGASMGGTYVVSAGTKIRPPVAAVVSLSGPLAFAGVDAAKAAPSLRVPVLYAAAESDSTFADAARALHRASAASPDARVTVVPGSSHGHRLVRPGRTETVRQAVAAFLAEHAPPTQ